MARLSAACRGARLTDGLFPFAEDADGLSGPWQGKKKEKKIQFIQAYQLLQTVAWL